MTERVDIDMKMRRLGSVQQKMPCVFVTEVKEEKSRKRECQVSAASIHRAVNSVGAASMELQAGGH